MLNDFLKKIIRSKTIGGIEINLESNSIITINVVILKKQRNRIFVKKRLLGLSEWDLESLPKDIPYCLGITGAQVINKKIFLTEGQNPLKTAFPNVKEDDFLFQECPIKHGYTYLSIARKENILQSLRMLKEKGLSIIELSLGPFSITSVLSILDSRIEVINLEKSAIKVKGGRITDVVPVENYNTPLKFIIGTEQLENEELLPFSIAFQKIIGIDEANVEFQYLEEEKEGHFQKQVFVKLGWSILILFFFLLQANYLIFDYYSSKENEINSKLILSKDELQKYKELTERFEEKEKFLNQNGMLAPSRISFYADQMALDAPNAIQFVELQINPVEKKMNREDCSYSFNNAVIRLKGHSERSTVLNEWIKVLKKKQWIKEVILTNYHQDNSKSQGEFNIEIGL